MRRYAENTKVSMNRSREEIERLLIRFGAGQFGYMTDVESGRAHIMFVYRCMRFRISVLLPGQEEFKLTPKGRAKKESQIHIDLEREITRRWRSLTLLVKAKLVAVEDNVATFEEEFLPYLMWGDGRTTAQQLSGKIEEIAMSGKTPKLLPMVE